MRLAYADPPYLGRCKQYGHRHEPPWGRWDDIETHRDLLEHLVTFDGWACSTHEATRTGAPVTISRRMSSPSDVASWVKPFASFKAHIRIAYTWEPVLFVPGRDSSRDGAPLGRDHIAISSTRRKEFRGAKPTQFCRWVADLLGYIEGDELVDIFPGSGVMAATLAQGALTLADPLEVP